MHKTSLCRRAPKVVTALFFLLAGALPVGAQIPGVADYRITFEATWSQQTHPQDFPSASAHFSSLLIGTHNDQVSFWEMGGLATPGIEAMAESGFHSPFDMEVAAAIYAGTAESYFTETGFFVPDVQETLIQVSEQFPRVTLVSMIAPSPDWFVGVSGLELFTNGSWVDEVVVDVFAYDAGTDNGATYISIDSDTSPPDPISLVTSGPLTSGGSLGTLRFQRVLGDPFFIRGDCEQSSGVDIGDTIYLLAYLFTNGPGPVCRGACDVNGDLQVSIADAVSLLTYLFQSGPAPGDPFPDCGGDPSPIPLSCNSPLCPPP